MAYEDYLEEMERINKEEIDEEGYCDDNERYHIVMDSILLSFLKDMGYKEMVNLYEEARHHFWYS